MEGHPLSAMALVVDDDELAAGPSLVDAPRRVERAAHIKAAVDRAVGAYGFKQTSTTVLVNGVKAEAANAKSGDQITVIVKVPMKEASWLPGIELFSGDMVAEYTLRKE